MRADDDVFPEWSCIELDGDISLVTALLGRAQRPDAPGIDLGVATRRGAA